MPTFFRDGRFSKSASSLPERPPRDLRKNLRENSNKSDLLMAFEYFKSFPIFMIQWVRFMLLAMLLAKRLIALDSKLFAFSRAVCRSRVARKAKKLCISYGVLWWLETQTWQVYISHRKDSDVSSVQTDFNLGFPMNHRRLIARWLSFHRTASDELFSVELLVAWRSNCLSVGLTLWAHMLYQRVFGIQTLL